MEAAQAAAAPIQVQLLVWIFVMRVLMVVTSIVAYVINQAVARSQYENAERMDFEKPLTWLVWLTSIISVAMTYASSWLFIPELVKIFTSTNSSHVKEVVASSRQGGASLNILSGLTAGNFSAFWMGLTIVALMAIAYGVSLFGLE